MVKSIATRVAMGAIFAFLVLRVPSVGHWWGGVVTPNWVSGLLGSVPRFWDRYFSSGEVEVIGTADDRIVLRVDGWSTSEPAAELVAGFLERVAELTGVARVRVLVSAGALAPIFTVEWSDDVDE